MLFCEWEALPNKVVHGAMKISEKMLTVMQIEAQNLQVIDTIKIHMVATKDGQ